MRLVVAIWAFCIVASSVASADPLEKPTKAEAREHLTRGNRLYNLRSFDEAIAEYKAGALIEPRPVFDYNLGQCYRLLGKYDDAIWHYERFLERGKPQGDVLDAVQAFISHMREELEHKAMTQKPTDVAPPPAPEHAPLAPALPRQPAPWYADRIGWALGGAGLLAVGVGGGLLASAASLSDDANHEKDQSAWRSLRDRADRRETWGVVVGIGGTALLVAGIIKLAAHESSDERIAHWTITPSGNALVLAGTF